jgi:steroid delta-isomerase
VTTPREVAESYWHAEERRDVDAVLAHFRSDAVFHPVSGPLVGHEEIRTFYDGMGVDFPGLEVTIVRDITHGDEAALEWTAVLVDDHGRRFEICGVNLVTVNDGKFVHMRSYYDPTSFPQPGIE